MPRTARPNSRKQTLLNSRKDRIGVLLLLAGVTVYWLAGRILGKSGLHSTGFQKILYQNEVRHTKKFPVYSESRFEGKAGADKKKYISNGENFRRSGFHHKDSVFFAKKKLPDYKERSTFGKLTPLLFLNKADSASWEELPGIGPVLAARIIKYRDKLGGFYASSQLSEVFGIADTVLERILPMVKPDSVQLRKININNASLDELRHHPYLKWEIAKAIIRYREAHGSFQTIDELRNIWNLAPETLERVSPYLTLGADSSQ